MAPHPDFISLNTPLPEDLQKLPRCAALEDAVKHLVNMLMAHYPDQEESLGRGCNVRVMSSDGTVDNLFRIRVR